MRDMYSPRFFSVYIPDKSADTNIRDNMYEYSSQKKLRIYKIKCESVILYHADAQFILLRMLQFFSLEHSYEDEINKHDDDVNEDCISTLVVRYCGS